MTKGRANEIERELERTRRELGERIAAAEARAAAAEKTATAIYDALVKAATKPSTRKVA